MQSRFLDSPKAVLNWCLFLLVASVASLVIFHCEANASIEFNPIRRSTPVSENANVYHTFIRNDAYYEEFFSATDPESWKSRTVVDFPDNRWYGTFTNGRKTAGELDYYKDEYTLQLQSGIEESEIESILKEDLPEDAQYELLLVKGSSEEGLIVDIRWIDAPASDDDFEIGPDLLVFWGDRRVDSAVRKVVKASSPESYLSSSSMGRWCDYGHCITRFSSSVDPSLYPLKRSSYFNNSCSDRYATMRTVVREAFPDKSDYVIVANGEDYADALAASGLAGLLNAPIVLVKSNDLPSDSLVTLRDLGPNHVLIVGGRKSVSRAVEDEVASYMLGGDITRISGKTRYETASEIYRYAVEAGYKWRDAIAIVSGANFADAISVSSAAYSLNMPVLLTNEAGELSESEAEISASQKFSNALIVGGTARVSEALSDSLESTSCEVTRVAGDNRYETSNNLFDLMVFEGYLGYKALDSPCVVTGQNYPDALSAAALSSKVGMQIVLFDEGSGEAFLNRESLETDIAFIIGGKNTMSDIEEQQIQSILTGYIYIN